MTAVTETDLSRLAARLTALRAEIGRVIVGQRAMVLRSEDAGKTWKQVLPKETLEVAGSE